MSAEHCATHPVKDQPPWRIDTMRPVWQRLPMGRGRILVPAGIPRIPEGVWLHAACRPIALAACNTIGHLSKVSVPLLRRGLEDWHMPVDQAAWDQWLDHVGELVGATPAQWLVMPAPDEHRARFSVILLDKQLKQVAYARWTMNPANLLSLRAESELTANPPETFVHPALLDSGRTAGWTYTLSAPLPPGPHRPANLTAEQRKSIVAEIKERLTPLVPEGEIAAHGDFTPWNVRTVAGEVVVIDWEQFGVGPAATDELWHVVTGVLATQGDPESALERVNRELRHYTPEELSTAATHWRRRETEAQPEEVEDGVDRSAKLVAFEQRISQALQLVEGLHTPGGG